MTLQFGSERPFETVSLLIKIKGKRVVHNRPSSQSSCAMLPVPVSLTRRGGTPSHRRPLGQVILSRSRLTNLGVLLLTLFAALSSVLNFLFYLNSAGRSEHDHDERHVEAPLYWTPSGISSTISRSPAVQALDHLVIMPGHAIWWGATSSSRLDEDEWILEIFQRGGGRVAAFMSHIERGSVSVSYSFIHFRPR